MTLENLVQYRPGVLLAEGEENRVHRIRASAEVHAVLTVMTAAERGVLVAEALAWRDRSKPAVRAVFSAPPAVALAPAEGAESAGQVAGAPSRPAGAPLTPKAAALLARLEGGGVLVHQHGGRYGVEVDGLEVEKVGHSSLAGALLARGLLVEVGPGRWQVLKTA